MKTAIECGENCNELGVACAGFLFSSEEDDEARMKSPAGLSSQCNLYLGGGRLDAELGEGRAEYDVADLVCYRKIDGTGRGEEVNRIFNDQKNDCRTACGCRSEPNKHDFEPRLNLPEPGRQCLELIPNARPMSGGPAPTKTYDTNAEAGTDAGCQKKCLGNGDCVAWQRDGAGRGFVCKLWLIKLKRALFPRKVFASEAVFSPRSVFFLLQRPVTASHVVSASRTLETEEQILISSSCKG